MGPETEMHSDSLAAKGRVTIGVTPRDRFSTTATCLRNIFKNSDGSFDVILSMGGAPSGLVRDLEKEFSGRVQFILEPGFRNTAQLRNLALKKVKTRLAVFLDSDVFVRPDWLKPLIECQAETGASLITPLVQGRDTRIHTAGNRFYIVREKGRAYVQMELCYAGLPAVPDNNLKREETDFAEIHCQLVVAEDARTLGIYDEMLREGNEMDSGLTLAKANRKMFVEPRSRVYLHYVDLIDDPDDARLHMWKWEMQAMREGFAYFYGKWNLDPDYRGQFSHYLSIVNHRVGFLTRRNPSRFSIQVDRVIRGALEKMEKIF